MFFIVKIFEEESLGEKRKNVYSKTNRIRLEFAKACVSKTLEFSEKKISPDENEYNIFCSYGKKTL